MSRTGWGLAIGAVALLVMGSVAGLLELVVLGLGCGLAVVFSIVLGRRRPALEVERTVDPVRATVGEVALARVTLRNVGARTISSGTFDERVGDERRALAFNRLGTGQARSITYRLPTTQRSVISLGPGTVRTGDPLGVTDSKVSIGGTTEFIVHPRRHRITSFPKASRRAIDGPEAQSAALGSMVFHALREYVPGDDIRHVHWKSSARSGSLMVRQFVDTDIPELTVVLDVRRDAYVDDGFEVACEAAASIIEAFHVDGYKVRLATSAGTVILAGVETHDLLDFLARLELVGDANLLNALHNVSTHNSGIGLMVITGPAGEDVVRRTSGLSGRDRLAVLVEIGPASGRVAASSSSYLQRIQATDGTGFAEAWNGTVRQ